MSNLTISMWLFAGAPAPADESAPVLPPAPASASETASASASESASAPAPGPGPEPAPAPEPAPSAGAVPPPGADPNAPPPAPGPPPEGVGAVGTGSQAPLPPPLAPVDPRSIRSGPWRGAGWVAIRITLGGPIGGEYPARARVTSIGGAGEVGWRLSNWLGVSAGAARRPHDQARRTVTDPGSGAQVSTLEFGHLTNIDFVTARGFLPVDGRVQPYADLGGGLAVLEPPDPEDEVLVGGGLRVGAGLDAWVARTVTLGAGILYRVDIFDGTAGHHLGGFAGLGLHW